MNCGVYTITNTVNGRVYVGSSVRLARRFAQHRQKLARGDHENARLQHAFTKYGAEAFTFAIVQPVTEPRDVVGCEQQWIDRLKSADRNHGYNILPSAGSALGMRHSPEARSRMSAARLGRKIPPEVRAKMAAAKRGTTLSAEGRAKISAANKGRRLSPEQCARISAGQIGHGCSDATKAKIGAWERTPEYRARLSAGLRGKAKSADHRARLAEANRGKRLGPQSAETIAKRVEATRLTKPAKAEAS